jgi:hypothetical protein
MLTWDPMGIEGTEGPAALALFPFYPNPSSAPVARLSIPEPALVEIRVFDLSGRMVLEIPGAEYASGYHDVLLGELSPGIYICRMVSGDISETERLVAIE